MADETQDRPEVTKTADLYQRHEQDPSKWEKAEAVTGRAADKPAANTTLADRAAARKPATKKVDADQVEDKAVTAGEKKAPAKRAAKKAR